MFVLIVVVLILIYIIVFDGVSSLIITLLSSVITLPVSYSSSGGYNGLLVALGIKPSACNLGGYGPGAYGLST